MGRRIFIVVLALLMAPIGGALASVEWKNLKSLPLGAVPRQVTISPDGRMVYVLAQGGLIFIYTAEGKLEDTMNVGDTVDSIAVTPDGNTLLMTDRAKKSIEVIRLDFIYDINTLGSPSKGPAEAPVSIVIFSDFQCPFCARLVPLLDQVLDKYPKEVRLTFKNYPIPNHPLAGQAALAALAAQEQGKFWEFHNKLFESGDRLTEERIDAIARELNLDMDRFNRDRQDEKRQKQILQDVQDASKAGVKGTPAVFVNGRSLRTRSIEGFQEMIDAELAKKAQRRQ